MVPAWKSPALAKGEPPSLTLYRRPSAWILVLMTSFAKVSSPKTVEPEPQQGFKVLQNSDSDTNLAWSVANRGLTKLSKRYASAIPPG